MRSSKHPQEQTTVAFLLIDYINDMEFPDGEKLFPHAAASAKKAADLKKRVKAERIPVIYVNDNYGQWQSDFRQTVDRCLRTDVRGRPVAEALKPDEDDYFILKPQFSGFFATPLEILLAHLDVKTLIIAGVAGNMCVQFTANDAYMRGYRLIVPEDASASNRHEDNAEAMRQMEKALKADTRRTEELDLNEVIEEARSYYDSVKE
ncbi:nicotinamidase-related amidase [Salsuginibacillus halophilus]|uniref:Nicotinamidase-related amidase n=1 Tax=Salsuginibacillus halophilus TaxID=517424 RepID=A0A2P8HE25_9BACI|nr:isochorismatase family cysteine hydrolase [Salsuginibacillus halophilus]PSL44479.1 nicotinamidase-related amidase [Salsuginibacillus halophilus]